MKANSYRCGPHTMINGLLKIVIAIAFIAVVGGSYLSSYVKPPERPVSADWKLVKPDPAMMRAINAPAPVSAPAPSAPAMSAAPQSMGGPPPVPSR